ncbi:unnamed protein product [Clavelina lepadiformis]|uniref:Sulfotransferase n=1 Tax=Clavelina lepadiformis TaxID=159417 RepID=A0ABP0FU19_CLALP
MKVILAGYCKTGTKSMAAALETLGYNVYDYFDHFWYHYNEWQEICSQGATKEIFQRMYKDVDVVANMMPLKFWKEIHDAFPDAKIILTTRDENDWLPSYIAQWKSIDDYFLYKMMMLITPTGRRMFKYYQLLVRIYEGAVMKHPFDYKFLQNETMMRLGYRTHQTGCIANAPKDKLLVYSVRDGWKPLCKFLGKEIPSKAFPRLNSRKAIFDKLKIDSPAIGRIKQEFVVSVFIISSLGVLGVYKLYRSGLTIPYL